MLTDILGAIVANGTTFGNVGYQPWLPFYNFLPLTLAASLCVILGLVFFMDFSQRDAIRWGTVYFTSAILAVLSGFGFWLKFDLNPYQVLILWAVNWVVWMVLEGQFLHAYNRKQIKEKKENAD